MYGHGAVTCVPIDYVTGRRSSSTYWSGGDKIDKRIVLYIYWASYFLAFSLSLVRILIQKRDGYKFSCASWRPTLLRDFFFQNPLPSYGGFSANPHGDLVQHPQSICFHWMAFPPSSPLSRFSVAQPTAAAAQGRPNGRRPARNTGLST